MFLKGWRSWGSGGGIIILYNPDLVRQRGLECGWPQPLWWLITIHLAAAVNIDSSRDFQFEPVDMLWNITMCVQLRRAIGGSGPLGRGPLTRSCLKLIYQLNSKNHQLLLSVWCYWVVHELIFFALNYWMLLFIFGLSHLHILVHIGLHLLSLFMLIAAPHAALKTTALTSNLTQGPNSFDLTGDSGLFMLLIKY